MSGLSNVNELVWALHRREATLTEICLPQGHAQIIGDAAKRIHELETTLTQVREMLEPFTTSKNIELRAAVKGVLFVLDMKDKRNAR